MVVSRDVVQQITANATLVVSFIPVAFRRVNARANVKITGWAEGPIILDLTDEFLRYPVLLHHKVTTAWLSY